MNWTKEGRSIAQSSLHYYSIVVRFVGTLQLLPAASNLLSKYEFGPLSGDIALLYSDSFLCPTNMNIHERLVRRSEEKYPVSFDNDENDNEYLAKSNIPWRVRGKDGYGNPVTEFLTV